MEKKVYELKTDPELRDLIPPLTEEEHRMLEDSIVRDGCDTPLTVWNGTIVDGHNRYEICHTHDIPFAYEEKDFLDKDAAMAWMLEHQLARRNLTAFQRGELALKYGPLLRKKASQRQATSSGGANPQLVPNLAQADMKGRAREELAKMAGVSHGTLDKVKQLDANADEETKRKLRAGELSIHKAYTDLKNKEHEGETRVCECCGEEKPFSDFTIPSNRNGYRPICKTCEANAKRAAKEAEEKASQPSAPLPVDKEAAGRPTGIEVKDGKTAHVYVGLPDDPAMFGQIMELLKHSQNAYIVAFESTINKYSPNMVTKANTDLIRQMIDYVADTTEAMLDKHLKNIKEEN